MTSDVTYRGGPCTLVPGPLVDLIPAVVYVFDLDERRPVYLNRFSTGLLSDLARDGGAGGDLLPRAVHPDDAPALAAHLERLYGLGDGVCASVEYRLRHRDGSWRWFASREVVLARHPDGRVRQVVGVAADITDRKDAERIPAYVDRFRATLGDSIRHLSDPVAVQAEAARVLGEHLGAARARYAEVPDEGGAAGGVAGAGGWPVVVCDVEHDPRLSAEERAASAELGIGAYLTAPLVRMGRPVARMAVHHARPHAWTPDEIALVEEALDRTWTAVERARAEQALRANEAAERQGRLRAERAAVLLAELALLEGVRRRLKRLVGFLARELDAEASVEVPGVSAPARAPDGDPRQRLDVPVELGNGARVVLALRARDPVCHPFGPGDAAFAREVTGRAGPVLCRARLREEEHRVSLRLQRALLPDGLREHPDVVVDAHYEAASTLLEVGGDWYDSFSWPHGQLGVMVGDVVGHDLQAAVAMGRLRAGVAALVAQAPPSAAAVLEALDRCAHGPDGAAFVTASALVVDPCRGELRYSRAGHPPALLVPPVGEGVWLDGAGSLPVTELAAGRRPEATRRVDPGSVVILFSDGLVERRGEPLGVGLERLRGVAVDLVRSGEPDLGPQLAAVLAQASPPEDDVVVVTLRYRPEA